MIKTMDELLDHEGDFEVTSCRLTGERGLKCEWRMSVYGALCVKPMLIGYFMLTMNYLRAGFALWWIGVEPL